MTLFRPHPFLGLSLLLLLAACAQTPRIHLDEQVAPSYCLSTLNDTQLSEVSGAAWDPHAKHLWVVNDSGNAAKLFALSTSGVLLDAFPINAHNHDWEDLALFTHQGRSWLIIADIGDNRAQRATVNLLILPAPQANSPTPLEAHQRTLAYPDAPRDAEAIALADDTLWLLSKRDRPHRLYEAGRLLTTPQNLAQSASMRFVGPLRNTPEGTIEDLISRTLIGVDRTQPTAMTFSEDGHRLWILTYRHVLEVTRRTEQSWRDIEQLHPRIIATHTLPQAEALAFDAQNARLFVLSEGVHSALLSIDLNSPVRPACPQP